MMRRAHLVTLLAMATLVLAVLPISAASAATSARDRAKAGVLVRSDFPTGWTQHKRARSSDTKLDAAAAKIATCKPFVAFSKDNTSNPSDESADFEQKQASVTNKVSVYPSTTKAVAAMSTFSDGRLPTCLEKLFTGVFKAQLTKSVAKQVASVSTKIAPITGVRIGDQAMVYQGTVDVGLKNGTAQTVGIGFLSVRVGDAIVGYSYTSDTDISAALQPAIVKSVKRLQDAQSAG
jgi:hypothetical protein